MQTVFKPRSEGLGLQKDAAVMQLLTYERLNGVKPLTKCETMPSSISGTSSPPFQLARPGQQETEYSEEEYSEFGGPSIPIQCLMILTGVALRVVLPGLVIHQENSQ
jgi:hypothetical protein